MTSEALELSQPSDAPVEAPSIPWRKKLIQLGVGLVVLIVISATLGTWHAEPLTAFGEAVLGRCGLLGVAAFVFVLDAWPLPALPHEPVLFLAITAGVSLLQLGLIAACASVLAAWLDYALGRWLGQRGLSGRFLGPHLARAQGLLERYGTWGIAGLAITPVPFAIIAFAAGTLRMRAPAFMLATLVRFPKAFVTVWLIAQGWKLGGGG